MLSQLQNYPNQDHSPIMGGGKASNDKRLNSSMMKKDVQPQTQQHGAHHKRNQKSAIIDNPHIVLNGNSEPVRRSQNQNQQPNTKQYHSPDFHLPALKRRIE